MPDFLTILTRWWKAIFGLTVIAAVSTAVILAFLPNYYLSVVTALPANGVSTDKGSIFNHNIQDLYPAIGLPDELDKIVGTASLDTIYIALVNKYDLVNHYQVRKGRHELYHAIEELKKNSSVMKSEYGELKIRVWDQDAGLAAAMANSYFDMLQQLHQQLQNKGNAAVLQGLQENYKKLQAGLGTDSLSRNTVGQGQNKLALFNEYERLINEYSLLLQSKPPVLFVVDHARPGYYVDRPRRWPVFGLVTFAAFLFGLLLAVSLERRSKA